MGPKYGVKVRSELKMLRIVTVKENKYSIRSSEFLENCIVKHLCTSELI
jgi:hypothetical protein